MPALVERESDEPVDLEAILAARKKRFRKLADKRLYIPAEEPFMEGHNTWCAILPPAAR